MSKRRVALSRSRTRHVNGPIGRSSGVRFRMSGIASQPLARSAVGSVLTGILGQGAVVVSGVLVARMLTVHDRGVVALVVVVPVILVQLGTMGVPRAVTFEVARPLGSAGSTLSVAIPIARAQVLSILIVGTVASGLVSAGRPDLGLVAFLALVYVPIGVVQQYGLAVLQGLRRFRTFNIIRLVPAIAYAVFAVATFVLGGADVPLVIVGWTSANAIATLLVMAEVRRELRAELGGVQQRHAQPPTTRSLLRFGVRSLVGSLSPLGSMGVDQLIVGLALSPATLGLYVVASSICNLPRFMAQSFGLVVYPHVAALTSGTRPNAIARLMIITTIGGVVVVGALELSVGVIVPLFFGPAYRDAVPVVRVLLLSAFLFGINRVLSDSLQGAGRPIYGTISEAIGGLTLAVLVALTWRSLTAVSFSVTMAVAAGVSLFTLATIGYLGIGKAGDAVIRGHGGSDGPG